MNNGFVETSLDIFNFKNGINEQFNELITSFGEATYAQNVDNRQGVLKPLPVPTEHKNLAEKIYTLTAYYPKDTKYIVTSSPTGFKRLSTDGTVTSIANQVLTEDNGVFDTVCFENKGTPVTVFANSSSSPYCYNGTLLFKLKNRRPKKNNLGQVVGYIDANGQEHAEETTVSTYAPSCSFVELHYDRLWLAGDKLNPDRLYFSTASVDGFDIQDFTVPIDEVEANQHGGFVDVPSFDGGKIIGLKVVFSDILVFKERTVFKIYGNNPSDYTKTQIFSSNGAIADGSIVSGFNGAFFLNLDGIYFYDGTNVNLISGKIQNIFSRINKLAIQKAKGVFYDNKYLLAVPLDESLTNNAIIVYDTVVNSFMLYTNINVNSFLNFNGKLYFSDDMTIKTMYQQNIASLPMIWETPYSDCGYKNGKKNSEYIYFTGYGTGKVKISCITEKRVKSIEVQLTGTPQVYKRKLKNKGRIFKLKFENVGDGSLIVSQPQLKIELDLD